MNDEPVQPSAPAGWYPEVTRQGTQRYWDGSRWTEHLAPLSEAQQPQVQNNDGLASLGMILGLLLPIVGLVIGIMLTGVDGSDPYGLDDDNDGIGCG